MKILDKEKLNIKRRYILLASILFSFIVILKMSSSVLSNTLQIAISDVVFYVTNYFFWAILLEYIYGAVKPINALNKSNINTILKAFISLSIIVLIHLIITNIIYYSVKIYITNITVNEAFNSFKPYVLKSIFSRIIDLIIIIILLKIIQAYITVQKQKLKVLALENELNTAQLETLRWQLNPHFLFNSLHTLNTLIGYDDERAQGMIIKITNLLRKMLSQKEVHLITFKEELEYFKNYLEIEQERFYDRLDLSIDIDEKTAKILVPTLILQPLIENAFKHGISRIEGKGKIELKASIVDDKFIIKIYNTVPKNDKNKLQTSTKVGLENLKNRLDKVYGKDYIFSNEKKDNGFTATLIINQIFIS